ncbi:MULTISPECIES: trypco2 family protein [unclassified Streptomyces]|uniref:trypco2 family protein n=1 Tax=unclassified Streptomyces TaxID=2593676 RepID=UPI0035E16FD4
MIELADMIRELREQLTTTLAYGDGRMLRFELGPVEVEASVAVAREGGGDAKVRLWVVDAGASGKYGHAETQRITLTLVPKVVPPGGGLSETAMITGDEVDDEI